MSAEPSTSAKDSFKGLPTSSEIHFAIVSLFSLIRSAAFLIILLLSQGVVFFHLSKPNLALSNALSTSSGFALDASPITSSLQGLITS